MDLLSIDDDLDLNIPLDSDSENTEPCYCFPLVLDTCYDILGDSRTFQVCIYSVPYHADFSGNAAVSNHTEADHELSEMWPPKELSGPPGRNNIWVPFDAITFNKD